jgi:hypothetical protein
MKVNNLEHLQSSFAIYIGRPTLLGQWNVEWSDEMEVQLA